MKRILVTGGAGYIGSHVCLELQRTGYEVVVLDNLANSSSTSLQRVALLSNTPVKLVIGDVRDAACLDGVFADHRIDGVIHLAGLKAVGESVEKPSDYFDCNVYGTMMLIQAMERAGCQALLFSSTATVYGDPDAVPVAEDAPLRTTNPYAATKLAVEEMLMSYRQTNPAWRLLSLRYFNPVGAHESGMIGEDPNGVPNNLFPFIAQVAVGRRPHLNVFGNDYDTPDGTGVRDYLHVLDLAEAHVRALGYLLEQPNGATIPRAMNIGTGVGYSVLECLNGWNQAVGRALPYQLVDRRPGDVAAYYARTDLANSILDWRASRTLKQMCNDHWRWQKMNPTGYA